MSKKVVLGLSGGVDSAVSALMLLWQGYEVYGHWLDIGLGGRADAELVAATLNIPFSVGDIRDDLEERVCKPFAQEYLEGKTPLPCARCNPAVKFPALFRKAAEVGAEYVATGHYAWIDEEKEGDWCLYRNLKGNDQSYMLARLKKEDLSRILFPLGSLSKDQVRAMARDAYLPVADKPDSMEICFIPDHDYAAWLERRGSTPPPGSFVDKNGKVLGKHKGIHHYTLGQRRGLGISAEGRLFVAEIRPETNEVVLSGNEDDLKATKVLCGELNLLANVKDGDEVTVRFRHSKDEYPAVLKLLGDTVEVELKEPARAPTPGQLAVFYRDDLVLGSGWIVRGM